MCFDLNRRYLDAVAAARACDPGDTGGCGVEAVHRLDCPCVTWLADESELLPLRAAWEEQACGALSWDCPPVLCPVAERGQCAPSERGGGGGGGVCSDAG